MRIIITHMNPDGDGVGCCVFLKHYYDYYDTEKKTVIVMDHKKKYDYLTSQIEINEVLDKSEIEEVIIVDCRSPKQLRSKWLDYVSYAKKVIIFDHHYETKKTRWSRYNKNITFNIFPDYQSCAELIYDHYATGLIDLAKSNITPINALLCGIYQDSLGLRNPGDNTTKRIIRLMELGGDLFETSRKYLEVSEWNQITTVGEILKRCEYIEKHKISILATDCNEMQKYFNPTYRGTPKMQNPTWILSLLRWGNYRARVDARGVILIYEDHEKNIWTTLELYECPKDYTLLSFQSIGIQIVRRNQKVFFKVVKPSELIDFIGSILKILKE